MVLLKGFISVFIVFLTSLIGFIHGNSYKIRARSLQDLLYSIRILESEILIGNHPLPQALINVYKKGKGEIVSIFRDIEDDLVNEEREDIYKSFTVLSERLTEEFAFNKADIEVFLHLGKVLGKTNRTDQEKNFQFIIKELEGQYYEANIDKGIYAKLYRSLGILVGMAIVIIIV